MSDLLDFATALAAKASPGPSGRVFRVWPWGMDTNNPDALMTMVSAGGHVLAQDKVTAADWSRASNDVRPALITGCLGRLVAKAIKPTLGRYRSGLRAA